MKKIISLLLTIGMLATLFVAPVSAETVDLGANVQMFVLGEGTELTADGQYAIFDEVGDFLTYTFDVEESAAYDLRTYINFTSPVGRQIAPAWYIDGVLLSTGFHSKDNSYVGTIRNFGAGSVWLEAGRHTVKVENFLGEYQVRGLFIEKTDKAKADVSTTFSTFAGISGEKPMVSTDGNYTLTSEGTYPVMMRMNDADADEIHAKVGIREPGLYKVDIEIEKAGNIAADNNFKLKATLGASTNTITIRKEDADTPIVQGTNFTLLNNVALGAGTYDLDIVKAGEYGYYGYFDQITVTKVGEITSYPTVSFKTSFDNAVAVNGAAKVYSQWTTVGSNQSIDWKFTVPQSGYYAPKLTWTEYIYDYINPRLFIDGACIYGSYVTGDGVKDSDPLKVEVLEELTVDPIYLTAGEHIVRVANGSGYMRIHQLDFTGTAPVANAVIKVPANVYEADTSSALEAVYSGTKGNVVYFEDGSYVNYKVYAPANGFYNVGVNMTKGANTMTFAVSANGTEAKSAVVGVEGTDWRTVDLAGSVYLAAGMNDVLVNTNGVRTQTFGFVFTPVAYANRTVSAKAATLYAGDAVATAVEAGTEYTAVADISGAYLNKAVNLVVGVYAGGKLVAAHSADGRALFGNTITKTFTTPAEAGDYTVKVFMFDGLNTLKPYTTNATVVNPAVAAAE